MENDFEIVKMSCKGQLVVPREIRVKASLTPGERFVAFPIDQGVLFKKVSMPKVQMNFNKLVSEIESQFKKKGVTKKDVKGAVAWARN